MLSTEMIPASHLLPSALPSSKDTPATGASVDTPGKLDFYKLQSQWIFALLAGAGHSPVQSTVPSTIVAGNTSDGPSLPAQGTDNTTNQANLPPVLVVGGEIAPSAPQGLNVEGKLPSANAGNDVTPAAYQPAVPPTAPLPVSAVSPKEVVQSTPGPRNAVIPTAFSSMVSVSSSVSRQEQSDDLETDSSSANGQSILNLPSLGAKIQANVNVVQASATIQSLGNEHSQTKNGLTNSGNGAPIGNSAAFHGVVAPDGKPASTPDVATQIATAITSHLEQVGQQGKTDFSFHLDPPNLGPVRIHLTSTDGVISARLVVREDGARQILESQMSTLVQRLTDAGISLGRFDVSREGAGFGQQWQESAQANPSQQQMPAPGPTFVPSSLPAQPRGLIDLVA
jgi:flagellar hook-length control protein FliK